MIWLRQSTARTLPVGPFVDSGDGFTAETTLTIAQADIRLSKNGGAFAQTNNGAGATHLENGYYGVPLDATDTGTLGHLKVAINESGALPVWADFMVLPQQVWDSLFGADRLQVDVQELAAAVSTQAADALLDRDMATGTDSGTETVRTVRQALRALRNRFFFVGTTRHVTKEDDTTDSWTSVVTTSGLADPIIEDNPTS